MRSVISGVGWPAMPDASGAAVLALVSQLEEAAWWPRERLERAQREQLGAVVAHAVSTVPHYRGLPAQNLEDLPILSRRELQQRGKELRTRAYPKGHGSVTVKSTSGSTGRPVDVMQSGVEATFWCAITMREHLWHERDFSQRLAAIRYFPTADATGARPPDGLRLSGWGPATDALYPDAPVSVLGIEATIEEQLAWLEREQPTYLLTHPSNLHALLQRAEGRDLGSIREVRTVSETLSPETRALCREVLGVKIVDIYSSQEVGYIALQCPEHAHYHVQAESLIVEVLGDDDRPCQEGEVGRVVVTTLHNFATPLLRYDIGDYAEVGGPCPCGRGLPVLKRILGRRRNMLHYPNGDSAWPLILSARLRAATAYQQLQLEQTSREKIIVHVVPDGPLDEAALVAALTDCLGFAFDYEVKRVDVIARSASGKFEELISRIDDTERVSRST